MTIRRNFVSVTVVAALASAAASCSPDVEIVRPAQPVGGDLFRSYVSIGNSLTAGFQSGGITDTTQLQAYPVLLAEAVGTPFNIPLLANPGCPPPIINFQTNERLGGGDSNTCSFRDPASVTAAINNVAVFGATSADPTSRSTANSNPTTMFILGGETQVERALEADPSFVSIWIGNNDVLEAALSGILPSSQGVSRGVTSQAEFETNYNEMLSQLEAGADLEGGLLIGVINVTATPLLFPAAALVNSPQFKGAFDQFAGATTTLLPSCTATTTSLISFMIVAAIRDGSHPPVIGCEPEPGPLAPVGNVFVLDSTEQVMLAAAVDGYNAFISTRANDLGFAYLDPNPTLAELRSSGAIPAVPNLASPTAPFGDYISLDGVHPSAKGQAVIANAVIDAINQEYQLSIPSVSIP
jgi:lysophospholipase L1-like esterase